MVPVSLMLMMLIVATGKSMEITPDSNTNIRGRVLVEDGHYPLKGANILSFSTQDSKMFAGTECNSAGEF